MRANWTECPNEGRLGRWAGVWVTMNPKGRIVLGKKVYKQLGEPGWVKLLFDKTNRRIGIQPAEQGARNVYRVSREGPRAPMIVRAFRLMMEFDVHLDETVQFDDAEINAEGILVLDLRTARSCVMGRRRNDE